MADPKDFWFVAVLKELPQARRERVIYVFVGAFLITVSLGFYFAPGFTAFGSSGMTAWGIFKRFFVKG
jgi:hypothetical protein